MARGRPKKHFEESSDLTKKRRIADLITTRSLEELKYAVAQKKRVSDQTNTSMPDNDDDFKFLLRFGCN